MRDVTHAWKPQWLGRSLLWLFVIRAMRSASQGFLGIIVPLYLALLGYDAIHLGILFTAASVASAVMAALTGILSDRFGRKTFLALLALFTAAGGAAFALSRSFGVLVAAAAIGTIGRGGGAASGGNWGPFYPAEQALIAEHSPDTHRTTIFGALSFVGVIAGALGSLLAWMPHLLATAGGMAPLAGYRILFGLSAVVGVAMAVAVLPVTETSYRRPAKAGPQGQRRLLAMLGLSRESWSLIGRMASTNALQGLGNGLLGPILVYWFYRAYGVHAGQLANLFFIINLAAALPYLMAGRLASWLGSVRTVVLVRVVSIGFLVGMALAPTYLIASVLYTLRMIMFTLAVPVSQSYLMGIINPAERASAAGLSTVPWQVTSSAGPYVAGYLMQYIALDLPLELSAGLGIASAALFYVFFRNIAPPEEMARWETGRSAATKTG